jgi:hypothetical protein
MSTQAKVNTHARASERFELYVSRRHFEELVDELESCPDELLHVERDADGEPVAIRVWR